MALDRNREATEFSHGIVEICRQAPVLPAPRVAIRPMRPTEMEETAILIGRAMNLEEGEQALRTFRFHFACKSQGLDDGRSYDVWCDGGSLMGIVGLHHYVWGPPENVWLAWFAVDPAAQQRGIGRCLLDFVEKKARIQGYMKIFVETYSTPEFARARDFYRAQGFSVSGGVKEYLTGGGDMVVFVKELSHAL